jgi:hypothetical protein
MVKLIPSLIVALAVAGCAQEPKGAQRKIIEASATASIGSDVNPVTREATSSELEALGRHRALYDAVNEEYPKPARPVDAPRLKVNRVSSNGHIHLQDGRTIAMDGLVCSIQGAEYLGRWFTGPNDFLVVVPTGATTNEATPANVWVVDDLEGGGEGEAFPADAAVTAGWCSPVKTSTSTLTERFAALEAAFAEERQRHAP